MGDHFPLRLSQHGWCSIVVKGIRSKVKTATGRIGDKQNGDTPKRRQPDRRQFGHIGDRKNQNGEKAASKNGDNDRRGKREKEEGRGGKKNNH